MVGAGGLGPELLETCGRVCSALIMQGKKHNRQTGCMNPKMLPHGGETSGCKVLSAHLWSQLCISSIKTWILIFFFFPLRLQVESWKVCVLFIPGNGAQVFTLRTVWRHCKIFWITLSHVAAFGDKLRFCTSLVSEEKKFQQGSLPKALYFEILNI